MEEQTLKVQKIKNGIVIDHIPSGYSLKILKILGIEEEFSSTVSVLIHVPSKSRKFKDIVKIEDRFLDAREINKISLITLSASVNVIQNFNVVEKHRVQVPMEIKGLVKCANPSCVTNQKEPVEAEFNTISSSPLIIKCRYCDREMYQKEIMKNII